MNTFFIFLSTYHLLRLGLGFNIFTVTPERHTDLVVKQPQRNNSVDTYNHFSDVMNEFEMLGNWSNLCNISQTGRTDFNIMCIIKRNSSIKLSEFRDFTYRVSSNIRFDISVTCKDGIIYFPWPFRADKLHRIYIKDCRIKDYNTEFKNSLIDQIPDTIKYLQMDNVTTILRMEEVYDSLSKVNSPITRAAECGPENAIVIIRRGTKTTFEDMQNNGLFNFSTALTNDEHYFDIQKRTCLYDNLEVFEISGMNVDRQVVDKIVQVDVAENLKVLNFSGNGMSDTLYKLQGWRLRFPVMEYIDLSDNNIRDLPMIRDFGMTVKETKSVGIIDLRRNKITSLTKGMIDSFSTHRYLKVDISENPFLCDCGIIEVMEYLYSKTMPKAYDYLGSIECANPSNVCGRKLKSLSLTDLNCNNETVFLSVNLFQKYDQGKFIFYTK
ncbi:unnamed protein product [Mytilus edulis]|uniref:Uncharacterized protein n=1 Tax=Mytilus edulis TaxID=6550 RepID=A0A8S3U3W4_MYTED|nr:unnamed protein product [Mytilus edulis]